MESPKLPTLGAPQQQGGLFLTLSVGTEIFMKKDQDRQ